LTLPEQLLVWGVRQWSAGRDNWPGVERAFRRVCRGAAGAIAAGALAETVGMLAVSARRPVVCRLIACRLVSLDEQAILSLVAASQANDRYHAETQARDLMPACMVPVLLESVAILGAALAAAQHDLPPRYAFRPAGATTH
jgi:hypothetical protein